MASILLYAMNENTFASCSNMTASHMVLSDIRACCCSLPAALPTALSTLIDAACVSADQSSSRSYKFVPFFLEPCRCHTYTGERIPCAPISRTTRSSKQCRSRFWYNGIMNSNCVWINGVEACPVAADGANSTQAAVWEQCSTNSTTTFEPAPTSTVESRVTISGAQCRFPFVYLDNLYWSCTALLPGDSTEYCRARQGFIEPCAADNTTSGNATTPGGRAASQPSGVALPQASGGSPERAPPVSGGETGTSGELPLEFIAGPKL